MVAVKKRPWRSPRNALNSHSRKRLNKRRSTMKETEAVRAVLLEELNALGAMRDDLVIVGGWVPDLL